MKVKRVIVVEDHPWMRAGLLTVLREMLPHSGVKGTTSTEIAQPVPQDERPDLMVVGLSATQQAEKVLDHLTTLIDPEAIVLLTDECHCPSLCGTGAPIRGCLDRKLHPTQLQTALQHIIAGGSCFPAERSRHSPLTPPWPTGHRLPAYASLGTRDPRGVNLQGQLPLEHPHGVPMPGTSCSLDAAYSSAHASEVASQRGAAAGRTTDTLRSESVGGQSARPSTAEAIPELSMPVEELCRRARMLNVTPRQYEVLLLLARGYPIKTVSRVLDISPATAKAHASSLYQRLNVNNKGQAVFAARQRGALPPPF